MAAGKIHVALLRGINVGGRNRLAMDDLRATFVEAGCRDVRTYIQSGNVVYRAAPALARRVPSVVASMLQSGFGLRVPVVVRTAAGLNSVLRRNPFLDAGEDPRLLHVVFLAARPGRPAVAALDPERSPPDRFAVRDREIYLHCPGGVARTKLTNDYFDRTLATTSTMRNWRTVEKLAELAGGVS